VPAPLLRSDASILLIRPDHLGDLLLSYSAVGLLRRGLPHAHLTYLVGAWGEEIARRGPPVDEVLACPFPGFTRRPKPSIWQPYRLLLAEAARLRGRYEAAVVLRPDHWWGALLAAAAGIPVRVGYATPDCAPLLTHPLPWKGWASAEVMAVEAARRLLALVPNGRRDEVARPERFRVTTNEHAYADELLREVGLADSGPLVALHPGAGARLKRWPSQRWAAVGAALVREAGARIVVTGGAEERELAERVAAGIGPGAVCVAGRTGLGQLAAVLERARLALGPDSGPLHLAAAVGTPTLRLFGPTDPGVFMPLDERGQHALTVPLACRPCGNPERPPCGALEHPGCLQGLTVEQVVEQALHVLAEARGVETGQVVPSLAVHSSGGQAGAGDALGESGTTEQALGPLPADGVEQRAAGPRRQE
jgi:lipopolysaccharide heptosyltransferase II